VQPYIAIGLYLKERGHRVIMVTEERMRGLAIEFGLEQRTIMVRYF
jgi:UDP:flavonoid glycosyltransferase YjiC (YdhE family)